MNPGSDWSTLYAYTMARGDVGFVHQHVVDAQCAQEADASTPAMRLIFALVGLYLHVERGYTGKAVQRVHAALASRRPEWPVLVLPPREARSGMTAREVLEAPEGPARDAAISAWCGAVWRAYAPSRTVVVEFLRRHGVDEWGPQ